MYKREDNEKSNSKQDEENEEKVDLDVLVIDIGTGSVKVGWAGEDAPRFEFPTIVMNNNSPSSSSIVGDESQRNDFLVGNDAIQALHDLAGQGQEGKAIRPVRWGECTDMNAMFHIIQHIYTKELDEDASKYPVLLTCAPLASAQSREAMAQKLFKDFRVPSLYIANASVLSLFSTGRTTGVVLDAGAGITSVVPVYEGCSLPYATFSQYLAGLDLTRYLKETLADEGLEFSEAQFDIVQDILETRCSVRLPENLALGLDDIQYELPDSTIITIGDHIRYKPAELLFNPAILPETHTVVAANLAADKEELIGAHQLIFNSIKKCDRQLQRALFNNLVLAGGVSIMPGFCERLRSELSSLLTESEAKELCVLPDSQRRYASWIGGSMMGSLSTFSLLKYTRQDYNQDNDIVHKKYF